MNSSQKSSIDWEEDAVCRLYNLYIFAKNAHENTFFNRIIPI